jgi:hypothetical protein
MENKLQIILEQSTSERTHKKIEAISKKTAKIEKLKKDLELLIGKVKMIKEKVEVEISETKKNLSIAKEAYIYVLIDKYAAKGLLVWQRNLTLELIQDEYEVLLKMGYRSEKLANAIDELLKENIEKKELGDEMLREMFDDLGLEEEMDFEDFRNPEFREKMNQKFQEANAERQKEFEKEQQIENTDVDFQKLYKNLAKLVHPDLCKEELEKAHKEQTMKQLTEAWEKRDYYEILMLWIAIDPDNTIGLRLNEENQKNIIKQLNSKINDLEYEQYQIKNEFSDTSFYYINFNAKTEKGIHNKIKKYARVLDINLEEVLDRTIEFKKTNDFKKHLVELNNQYNDMSGFDDIYEMLKSIIK